MPWKWISALCLCSSLVVACGRTGALADEDLQNVGGSGEEAGREASGGTVGLGGASGDAGSGGLGGGGGQGSTGGFASGGQGSTGGFAAGGQAGGGQPPPPLVVAIATGTRHSCALLDTGAVRCWGRSDNGALGYPTRSAIGDDEFPSSAGDVDVGGRVIQIAAGDAHTCALLDGGRVRCWGASNFGQLGYANQRSIGDDESPSAAGDVDVGGEVVQIAAAGWHTCALLRTGAVRCWGHGKSGALGYGNKDIIGDDETPARAGDVDVGGPVELLALGFSHTCALLRTGDVRCWGTAYVPGQLGFPNQDIVGDDETPASVGTVDVGGPVTALSAGIAHTCAVLDNGALRCWGDGSIGVLGYGNTEIIGDNETPRAAGDVNIGGAVARIGCGSDHSCAVLRTGEVRCWGNGVTGALGYGNTEGIGDDEAPASAGDVLVGAAVLDVAAGDLHTCALLATGRVRCWGSGFYGALGYANTNDIGDNEVPASVGDVPVL